MNLKVGREEKGCSGGKEGLIKSAFPMLLSSLGSHSLPLYVTSSPSLSIREIYHFSPGMFFIFPFRNILPQPS